MDKELQEILDAAGLSAEDRAKAEAAFSIEGLAKTVKAGTMRQADYSRKQDELAKRTQELNDAWEKANTEYVGVMDDYESTQKERDEAKKRADAAEAKAAEATKKAEEAKVDTSKLLTQEQLDERLQKYAAGQTAYFGDTLEIIAEHHKLFGTSVNPKEIIQQSMEAKKTPMQYWEEKYNVSAKRKELADAAEKTKNEEAEKRGYQKRVEEEANPATRDLSPSKNPFFVPKSQDGKDVQPWDSEGPTQAESELLNELQRARA